MSDTFEFNLGGTAIAIQLPENAGEAMRQASLAGSYRAAAQQAADDAAAVPLGHVVDFAETPDEGDAILAANYSNPATRYSHSVDGNGYLILTAIQASLMIAGFRARAAARKIGREITLAGTFDAAGFGTTTGPAIGFDTSRNTGANAQGAAESRYIVWRSNGIVQVQDGQGVNQTATEGYTITTVSGAVPTFAAADLVTMKLMPEAPDINGVSKGLLTLQKGNSIYTARISPLPTGLIFGGANLTGHATPGSRQIFNMRQLSWQDATIVQQSATTNVAQQILVGNPINATYPSWGSPVRYGSTGTEGLRSRAIPAPFVGKLPFHPIAVHGPGHADLSTDAISALIAANPGIMTNGVAYINGASGSDTTGAINDPTKPFLTPQKALRDTAARLLICEDGSVLPWDFRLSTAGGQGAFVKLIAARNPGRVRVATPGTDISTLTFTESVTNPGVWQTTYPAGPGGIHIHRLVCSLALDRFGMPARAKRRTSLAEVDAEARAYWADTATRTLYITWDGLNIETFKALFKIYWMNAAGTSRIFQMGTTVGMSGLILDGIEGVLNNDGNTKSRVHIDSCLQIFSPNYCWNDSGFGGEAFVTRSWLHAGWSDGINLNNHATYGDSITAVGNAYITEAGDADAQLIGASTNRQAISSHSGLCALFGVTTDGSLGQEVADTSNTPGVSASWLAGVLARDGSGRVIAGKEGFSFTGNLTGADRQVWIDSCDAPGLAVKLSLNNQAAGYVFNSPNLLPATVTGGSVQPVAYSPEAP